jgi:hypothetical protein
MALLTNEQLAELIGIASNQSTSKDLHDEFHEWNKKQTGVQVIIDWDKAPEIATGATVKFYWVGEGTWTFGQTIAQYDRPKPVITPHPHAEMIMKYAEVAQRRVDPWVEFEITFDEDDDCWSSCDGELRFLVDGRRYRYIGETK